MSGHSVLPPSSADKWTICHGWARATEHLPNVSSPHAIAGTKAHSILETTLRFDLEPHEVTDDVDIAINVGIVVDWLKGYLEEHPGADYHMELRSHWHPAIGGLDMAGTADLVVVSDEEIVIGDYKNGFLLVEVWDSKQLRLYLLGLIERFGKRKKYKLVIFQPRAYHEDGPIREYAIKQDELDEFEQEAKYAAKENLKPLGGKRVAGEHCRHFCLAAPTCRVFARYALTAAIEGFAAEPVSE